MKAEIRDVVQVVIIKTFVESIDGSDRGMRLIAEIYIAAKQCGWHSPHSSGSTNKDGTTNFTMMFTPDGSYDGTPVPAKEFKRVIQMAIDSSDETG